jgi:hypothetical protein
MAGKQHLRDRWEQLSRLDGVTPVQRGFELEALLLDLARSDGMECSPSFRAAGEQMDGLLELDGRHLLLEAKWVAPPVPASEIYSFRAKVEGRLVGTVGVFVAVNGFADAVPDVLRFGKQINVVLFNGQDVWLALQDEYTVHEVIRVKLRRAAQYGEVFYTFQRFLDERSA